MKNTPLRPKLTLSMALFLAAALGACGTPLEKPSPAQSLRYRVMPSVAFEMLHDDETLAIVDLRTHAEFSGPRGHLARAYNIPVDQLAERIDELSDLRRRTFLIYCGDEDVCGLSALELLHAKGFRAVLMDGGIEEWVAAGFGTVDHATDCVAAENDQGDPHLALIAGIE